MGLEKPSSNLASSFKAKVRSQPEWSYLEWLQLIEECGELLDMSSPSASPCIGKRLLVVDDSSKEESLCSLFFPKSCSAPLVVVPMNPASTEPRRGRSLFKEM